MSHAKIRSTDATHAKEIQEFLFSEGYTWHDGTANVHLPARYFFLNKPSKKVSQITEMTFLGDNSPEEEIALRPVLVPSIVREISIDGLVYTLDDVMYAIKVNGVKPKI